MKKLSFIFAMVLAAGTAMAQNSATISSVGNFENATINQGVANNNIGDIIQTASGSALTDPTVAIIVQVSGNDASISQAGFRQYANIYQEKGNLGTVVQKGSWNGSMNYIGGNYNTTSVVQDGGQNSGNIRTLSDYNNLSIDQLGDRNFAQIHSGWNYLDPSARNMASISQQGDDNHSEVTQDGGNYNSATISQSTDFNVANLNQTGSGLVASIDQEGGNYNSVELDQTGGKVDIDQNGCKNMVFGSEVGDFATFAGSTLDVEQIHTGNTLSLESSSLGAIVNVYQDGMTNTAVVIQD